MSLAEVMIRKEASGLQGSAGIGPSKGFGEDVIEVLDELLDPLAQVLEGTEVAAIEDAPGKDGEPKLDLVEPRAVSWGVDEAYAVLRVLQEGTPARLRFQNPMLALHPQFPGVSAVPGHHLDQGCRTVGIELFRD
jgi:hypothetical protein